VQETCVGIYQASLFHCSRTILTQCFPNIFVPSPLATLDVIAPRVVQSETSKRNNFIGKKPTHGIDSKSCVMDVLVMTTQSHNQQMYHTFHII